ncbi:ATP-binding protein [Gluconobacter sp. OJB]|uniref:ATP-binding response regulator n=1 Tax=Gluconobacter sp. OJB TaxID=3145196 RepID=UPI0031F76395
MRSSTPPRSRGRESAWFPFAIGRRLGRFSAERKAISVAAKLATVIGIAGIGALLFLIDRPYRIAPVIGGTVDLSSWDCRSPVALDGEWQAIGNTLAGLTASSRARPFSPFGWTLMQVPGFWRQAPNLNLSDGRGAVTYRLTATLPVDCERIILEVPDPRSALNIWADGELLASIGHPSLSADHEQARALTGIAPIRVVGQRTAIAIEVSNHQNEMGGIAKHVLLGGDFVMRQRREGELVGAALIAGALLSMLVFTMAFGRADDARGSFWLACLLCIFIIREVCTTGLLPKMVSSVDSDVVYRLEMLCVFLVWPLYSRVLRDELRNSGPPLIGWIIDLASLSGTIAICTLPENLFMGHDFYNFFYSASCAIYFLFVLMLSEIRNERGSIILTCGLVIFIEMMLHDFVEYRKYMPVTELAPTGALILMCAHVALKGRQFSTALAHARNLSVDLAAANRTLDARVQERTVALSAAIEGLEHAKVQAERTLQIRTRFLSHLSHEVRNPLNVILGTATLLRRRLLDKEMAASLDTIRSIGSKLVALLDDILDMARLESNATHLRSEPFDPGALLKELSDIHASQCAGKNLLFESRIACADVTLEGDAPRIHQILSNILNNAVKFTLSGTVEMVARVEIISPDRSSFHVEIADTGPGIAATDMDRIFEEFGRGERTQNFSGAGLGLAISKQLARAMGGDISVGTKPTGGSIFRFEVALPWRKKEGGGATDGTAWEPIGTGVTIMIVDDSPEARIMMSDYLALLGFSCVCADSAPQCVAELERTDVDVILLDMNLGSTSGLEVLSALRQHTSPVAALTPVIAVTASVMAEDVEAYLAAGVDSVVAKPVNFDELLDALRLVLGNGDLSPSYQDSIARQAIRRAAPAFAHTCIECALDVEDARSVGDMTRMRRAVHRLKGSAATFGYRELENCCDRVEHAIKTDTTDGFLLDRLQLVLKSVIRTLQNTADGGRKVER